ncbi:unnamed protein product [Brassica oleracea var. botrytis]
METLSPPLLKLDDQFLNTHLQQSNNLNRKSLSTHSSHATPLHSVSKSTCTSLILIHCCYPSGSLLEDPRSLPVPVAVFVAGLVIRWACRLPSSSDSERESEDVLLHC